MSLFTAVREGWNTGWKMYSTAHDPLLLMKQIYILFLLVEEREENKEEMQKTVDVVPKLQH